MKVLCIDGANSDCKLLGIKPLVEGDTYEVVRVETHPYRPNTHCYILKEYSNEIWFAQKLFAPISEIDETTFVRETIKQPATV